MLTVKQAAMRLGVTPERVRSMIYTDVLPAERFGRNWMIDERAVVERLKSNPGVGRPKRPKNSRGQDNSKQIGKTREVRPLFACDEKTTRELYLNCKRTLQGCYDVEHLLQAKSDEERDFYVTVADFFLQKKQQELIAKGMF
jgi:excisionase family DNA binding protein